MYGLEIQIENKYGKYIYELLKNTDVQRYMWQINSDDIVVKTKHGNKQGLFNKKWVNGHDFLEIIQKCDYYLIFADCKAFNCHKITREILNGADMAESSECELVFMCTDSANIEIYCKNKNIYNSIKQNCKDTEVLSCCDVKSEEIINRSMVAF